MSLGSFFRSLVNSEVMGEQIVISIGKLYQGTRASLLFDDAHLVLAATYLGRIKAGGGVQVGSGKLDINSPSVHNLTLSETTLFSCLDEGDNVRALSLHLLQRERPDIWSEYPKFSNEFEFRVSGLFRKLESGPINLLVQRQVA